MAFSGCCSDCKVPGKECRLVRGQCSHCLHIHCILKWLNSAAGAAPGPMCRREWKFMLAAPTQRDWVAAVPSGMPAWL